MSGGDEYTKVRVILVSPTRDAVLVSRVSNDQSEPILSIPKSLIHSADLTKLTWENATEIVEFRMFEWKAEALDL